MALVFSDNLIYVYHTIAGAHPVNFPVESPDGAFGLINTSGALYARFGMPITGSSLYDKAFAFDGGGLVSEDANCVDLPPDADPPFPPVWPYTWDTSLLYGRDHMNQSLKMIREDDFKFRVTITKNGVPVNITGATFTFSAKWATTDAATIFTRTLGSGITVVVAADGTIDIVIASANTSTLPSYVCPLQYDLEMVESDGSISTPLIGVLTVWPDIT